MRVGALGALLALTVCLAALLGLGGKLPDSSGQVTLLLFTLATWALEQSSLRRRPMDFSTAFVLPLTLAVGGFAAEAAVLLLASVFVRQMDGEESYPWDLICLLPGLIVLFAVLAQGKVELLWAFLSIALTGVTLSIVSVWSRRSLRGEECWLARAVEQQLSTARLLLLPLALSGALLPSNLLWMVVFVAPILQLVTKFSGDLGYRLEAMAGQRAREEAAESKQSLEDAQSRLRSLSEKQQMMEKLVRVFQQPLGPREAFVELRKITSSVIPYESLFFLKIVDEQRLRVQDHHCAPERWDPHSRLFLDSEPLLERAWQKDRALKGKAARKLVSSDDHLVVIPLKPMGMLYFGRRGEPFSKEEAGRLRFVSERAEGGLRRAEERAEFTQALAQEKQVSRQLQHQVALSTHLLKAAQRILGAPTEKAVFETLAESIQSAVEHRWGGVLIGEQSEPSMRWGQGFPALSDLDRAHFLSPASVGAVRKVGAEVVHSFPVRGEAESLGAVLIGRGPGSKLSGEEEDFLGTLACLVAGGLESLRLNERLKEAHQQVLQASKPSAIGRLAAGVAHELNSPLAAIGLAIESAMIRPEKAGDKLEKASNALERARKIVSDLLEHSRTSGAKREVVRLGTIFEGLMSLVEAQLSQRQVKVTKDCRTLEAGVLVNKDELNQILINLILNAADASEDGQEILVSAQADNLKVTIEVQDQGSGISEEDKSRVFDPFFTTKQVGRGTGLGLSVCRELVLRHQGTISFDSCLGKGTTFRLVFPRQDKWP